jgi:hypothetical protein
MPVMLILIHLMDVLIQIHSQLLRQTVRESFPPMKVYMVLISQIVWVNAYLHPMKDGLVMAIVMMEPMVFTLTVMSSAVMLVTATMNAAFAMVMIRHAPMNAAYQMVTTHLVLVVMVCPIVVLKMTTVMFAVVTT